MEQPEVQDSNVAEVETETPETELPEQVEQTVEEEEVEYEGEKYKVPSKLKDALLRQSDYTRKTQEIAETRKAIEAEKETFQQATKFHQEYLDDIADVRSMQRQLAQYQQINWDQLIEQDPQQALKYDRAKRDLEQAIQQKVGAITQKQQKSAFESERAQAQKLEQAREALKREIPNWSEEVANNVRQHALSLGLSEKDIAGLTSHVPVKLLYDSYLLKQLQSKQTKPAPEVQEKPVTTIKPTRSSVNRDPDKMSEKEWLEWRNTTKKVR